ncbi:MAG: lasso peptide biosynthesis B2 protein [Candidatus Acidiferrum sp.]
MWERLRRFRALEPAAQRIFLRAAILLPLLSLSLRLRGFGATQASLGKLLPAANQKTLAFPGQHAELASRMVRAAVHHGLGNPSCLEESLALWWLLKGQGIASRLRIGVRKESEKVEAHAWVEFDGAALNEPEARHHHYAAFEGEISPNQAERR